MRLMPESVNGMETELQAKDPKSPEAFIADKLEASRRDSTPVSRHQIAEELAKARRMPFRSAFQKVDQYCEESSPHTPDYLGKEFLVPYLKLWALLFAAIAVGTVIFTVVRFRVNDKEFWYGLVIAVVLGLIASWRYLLGIFREFTKD